MATYSNRSPWLVDAPGIPAQSFPTKRGAQAHADQLRAAGTTPRVRQAREGQWRVRVRIVGHPILTATFTRRVDAERWARQKEGEVASGRVVDPRVAQALTLRELLEAHARRVPEHLRKDHPVWYRANAIARDPIGAYSIANLRPAVVAAYRDRRLSVVSPATVTKELSLIHRVLQLAVAERGLVLPENPASSKAVPRPELPESARRTRRLNASSDKSGLSDAQRLLRACRSPVLVSAATGKKFRRRNRLLLPFVRFALSTGCRRRELLLLTWRDVYLVEGYILLRATTTKTRAARMIPLSTRARRVLQCLPRSGPRVFDGLTASALEQAFTRACQRAGLDDLRLHDLRHELTSRLFERTDLREMEIAAITGHKDLRMLMRYTHLRPEWMVQRFRTCWIDRRLPGED